MYTIELLLLTFLNYIGACGSEFTGLKHGIFLGIIGGSFVSYSNSMTNALVPSPLD